MQEEKEMGLRKDLLKRAGVLALALTLTASPMGVMAEEAPESAVPTEQAAGDVNQEEQPVEGTADSEKQTANSTTGEQPGAVTGEGQTEGEPETEDTSDGQGEETADSSSETKAEETTEGSKENSSNVLGKETPETETTKEDIEGEGETEAEEPSAENGISLMADGQYDTVKPVIESVDMPQNGQTLSYEDDLKISLRAYDADSEIDRVTVDLQFSDESGDGRSSWETMELTQNASDPKLYEGSYSLENVVYSKIEVTQIRVTDIYNNYVDWVVYDEQGNHKYEVSVTPADMEDISAEDITFEDSGATLKQDEYKNFSFRITSGLPETMLQNGSFIAVFKNGDYTEECYAGLLWDTEDTYTGSFYANSWMEPGTWTLEGLYFKYMEKNFEIRTSALPEVSYIVAGTEGDTEAPVIESVEIDRQGEILEPGDTVNITVKATDNVQLSSSATVDLTAAADIADSYVYVYLDYDSASGLYKGSFEVTEETYPCEWYISYISVYDEAGNYADDSSYWEDMPYYFRVRNGNTFVNPTYSVNISFMALDENGQWTMLDEIAYKNVERRTTLAEAGVTEPEVPEYPGLTFQGWSDYEGNRLDLDQQIVSDSYFSFYAVYDKAPVDVQYYYYDKDGYSQEYSEVYLVSKDTTRKEMIDKARNGFTPDSSYPGLTFEGWDIYGDDPEAAVGERYTVYAEAMYDKGLVRFMAHDCFKNPDEIWEFPPEEEFEIICKVAEPGEPVAVPENYTWISLSDEERDLGKAMTYDGVRTVYGYAGEGGSTGPADPDEPAETPGGVTLPEESVSQIVDMVDKADEGESVRIDMGAATVVPKDVLEAAKGKDVDIVLDMGGYTWTINGKDIQADNLKDINLEVKLNTDAIPSSTVAELAGDNPAMQLSLTHNGNFGFQATLTFNAGKEYAGKYGNLYWYDSEGKMVFVDAGLIQPSGDISLAFSHASDYVLVMKAESEDPNEGQGGGPGDRDTPQTDGQDKVQKAEMSTAEKTTADKSVKTGDQASPVIPLIFCVVSAAAIAAVLLGRKRMR